MVWLLVSSATYFANKKLITGGGKEWMVTYVYEYGRACLPAKRQVDSR